MEEIMEVLHIVKKGRKKGKTNEHTWTIPHIQRNKIVKSE